MHKFKLGGHTKRTVKRMKVHLIAFGIARDILKSSKSELELGKNPTISDLKEHLLAQNPEFEKLRTLRFAVNEEYREEDYPLRESDEVVIIPPVSGG